MSQLAKVQELVQSAQEESDKFFNKGNKAAGVRLRKLMQELKTEAQVVRERVLKAE